MSMELPRRSRRARRSRRLATTKPFFVVFVVFAIFVVLSPVTSAQMNGAPAAGYKLEPGTTSSAVPAAFRDESGKTVMLGDYFGKRPVVLVFAYYDCPMLCTQVLNGLSSALGVLSLEPGTDF